MKNSTENDLRETSDGFETENENNNVSTDGENQGTSYVAEKEDDVRSFYSREMLRIDAKKLVLEKAYNRIAWSRLAVFLLMVIFGYMGLTERPGKIIFLILGIMFLVGFLVLIRIHDGIEKQQRLLGAREAAVKAYPARFTDEWRSFPDDGSRYLDKKHTVARDLDLVGPGSLYQMLSICQSAYGKWRFADVLLDPYSTIRERKQRQAAIHELAGKKEFLLEYESVVRQAFVDERRHPTREDAENRPGNTYTPGKIRFTTWMAVLMALIPAGNIAVVILILLGVIQPAWILVSFIVGYSIAFGFKAKLDQETAGIFNTEMTSGRVYPIFKTIQDEQFESELLREIHDKVAGNDGMLVAQKKLSRLADLKNLDYNPVVGMLLTGFAGWNFILAYFAWKWDKEHGEAFAGSFDIIGELEEMGSFAVLSLVRETSLPTLSKKATGVRFTEMLHPLLDPESVVANTGTLESPLTIITGSNMSGKTTFLRTLAINMILSYVGAGVTAQKFISGYRKIFTSMRVQDDVTGGISTFYAEILRIKEMSEYIQSGKKVPALCLIDEIFKGTNSADRIVGAEEALRRLSASGGMVVVTTHDFELCSLNQANGEPAENFHFEEYYEGDHLMFDYTMKDGPCTTRNARALLKMAGLFD